MTTVSTVSKITKNKLEDLVAIVPNVEKLSKNNRTTIGGLYCNCYNMKGWCRYSWVVC